MSWTNLPPVVDFLGKDAGVLPGLVMAFSDYLEVLGGRGLGLD